MNLANLGFLRTAAISPALVLADPMANARKISQISKKLVKNQVSLALFPELAITGYTCEDLFFADYLHEAVAEALAKLAASTKDLVMVVGAPWQVSDGRMFNVAVVLGQGKVLGMVPKSALPNYGEFYDRRWFVSGEDVDLTVEHKTLGTFRLTANQLFKIGNAQFGIEVCEDLWAPNPPGARHALAGADLMLNLSASNELVEKASYRRDLVRMTSAQRICGYLYASSGPLESSKDLVFGGHLLACENGQLLAESDRFSFAAQSVITEFDIHRLRHERKQNTTFGNAKRSNPYPSVDCAKQQTALTQLNRTYAKAPFVPTNAELFNSRATEILNIQTTGLARRMMSAHTDKLVLGVSGGLDSTQAFLVCIGALAKLKKPLTNLHAITMPGPGTTSHTKSSAYQLGKAAKVAVKEIPIQAAVDQHLKDLQHKNTNDVVFENTQARMRTQILFNYANKVGGIVVGTGDLSELALGWCTFNADQMASYNVNASIPKTMMKYLVQWYADNRSTPALKKVLERVLDTPITPELLPTKNGKTNQETEAIIGPYELHDFFLFHWLRNGASPEKIYQLAGISFKGDYTKPVIRKWLGVFFRRFFTQQFKRTTLPPGPKVGSVSLSPRGDWRMPDEASVEKILQDIEAYR